MNCKPGDLAIVIRTSLRPELLGHIVEVVGLWPGGVIAAYPGFVSWECRYTDGRLMRIINAKGELLSYSKSSPVSDYCLRPIRPGDLHETEDERKEVPA